MSTIALGEVEPVVGTTMTTIGWGLTSDTEEYVSDLLFETQIDILDDAIASDVYGNDINWETIICIDASEGKGTCGVSKEL